MSKGKQVGDGILVPTRRVFELSGKLKKNNYNISTLSYYKIANYLSSRYWVANIVDVIIYISLCEKMYD